MPLASPCMRLTVPIASCATLSPLAKPQTSITATMISRRNMRTETSELAVTVGHGAKFVIGPRFARARWRLAQPYNT